MNPEQLPPSPEEVEHRKALILNQWQHLPPEDQIAVLSEQLRVVFESDAGAGLLEALQTEETKPDPFNQIFPITGVSRADLQERLQFSQRDILFLEDQDMQEIARRLEEHYVEVSFWGDLEFVARHVLEHKRQSSTQT